MPNDRFAHPARRTAACVLSTAWPLPPPCCWRGDDAPQGRPPRPRPGAAAQAEGLRPRSAAPSPKPSCPTPIAPTMTTTPPPPQTEGPYYKRSSPQRASLEPASAGRAW